MKKVMNAILLAVLVGSICAQETENCYKPDSRTTICEVAGGRVSVSYFDSETGYYSRTSYTAEEWRDSLYRKSLECKATGWNWNGSTCSKPVQPPPPVTVGPQHLGPEGTAVYTGPKTKRECNAAGYKWEGTCTGQRTKQGCKAAGGKWQFGTCWF
jgi:hypothetical protein